MTKLAEIAESVAKALGLKPHALSLAYVGYERDADDDIRCLRVDGLNLFDPYWQVRCRDWLLERGSFPSLFKNYGVFAEHGKGIIDESIEIHCPASEFCARAIAELMK